jgi:hypothetical protein
MVAGFLLGNPVTGSYEAHWDCTISWSLQDDSGGFQHFSGTAAADGKTVHFSQTDPGGAQHGIMGRTPAECKASDIRKQYAFTIGGTLVPMAPGQVSGTVDAKGLIKADESGNLKLTVKGSSAAATDATVNVDAQCMVDVDLSVPPQETGPVTPMKLRGVLIDDGREILAIQTDPGAMVTGSFTAP